MAGHTVHEARLRRKSVTESMKNETAILDGTRQNRTYILKRTIKGTFHQTWVKIGQGVSEELLKT